MSFTFDERGHLQPYRLIPVNIEEFEINFVNSFVESKTRWKIFENYLKFVQDFKQEIALDFTHWINGSFLTKKLDPVDIDFVTIINHEIFSKKEALIESKFRLLGAKNMYGVDAYTVRKYPESHRLFSIYQGELAYWTHWFSSTKKNRAKQKFPKGFVEIRFGD